MLVSWTWLSKYVDLSMSCDELALRLALAGLNHEGTSRIDDEVVIDLEVTSNRGDCLGHLGVAREISVLYGLPLTVPTPTVKPSKIPVESLLSVENQALDACPRYTARVIQGVKVGPSPEWLVRSLESVFWKRKKDGSLDRYQSINNVVDATNYVLMECGQPLHAFDYAQIEDAQIVVRSALQGEKMLAIDHKEYELDPTMCVIADARRALAIAGVMGGAASEVRESTTDLVIESAVFAPLSVRRTARTLKLHSPSSYRFERKVDPAGVDWASQRVCELITDLAGGNVADGVIQTAVEAADRKPVVLRQSQLERILGIQIDAAEVARILTALGCSVSQQSDAASAYVPPSWRHDLTREADLIEEVARIHGYEKIPDNAPIAVAPSSKRPFDTALDRIRGVLTAAGLSEAMTPSVVTAQIDEMLSPWTARPALETETSMLKGARRLRRTLLSSLLEGRAKNWAAASIDADLFEIAHIYLPGDSQDALPDEQYTLGLVSGADFFHVKGLIETLCQRLGIEDPLRVSTLQGTGFTPGEWVRLSLAEQLLGYLGKLDAKRLQRLKLPGQVVVAELSLPLLLAKSQLVPQQSAISPFPSIQRDLNFIVAEQVRWSELENAVRAAVGTDLAAVTYRETYRDPNKDGQATKRVLLTVELQRHDGTLSGEQADQMVARVIESCGEQLSAKLLS
jgi:phenylalanyl-tRNA synthetase beta chain